MAEHGTDQGRIPEIVESKLQHLPDTPGVYLWKDADGNIIYVGKAKRLRSRVRSYFAHNPDAGPKHRALIKRIRDVDTIVVPSEAHALILEATLIKEHRPRFNVMLRDDKTYPFIKVTVQEPFPRVMVTRRVEDDGARYFGPYTDVGAMRRTLNVVRRVFTVRSCHYALPREAPERPCLDYAIGRCLAPCVGYQSEAEYRSMIDEVVWFLEGRNRDLVKRIRNRMLEASDELRYESAARLRDALKHLEQMEEPTVVMEVEGGDRDVVGYARDGTDACVTLLRVRGGKLLAREYRLLENAEDDADTEILAASLSMWYRTMEGRARDLLIPWDFPDREALQESLQESLQGSGQTVRIHIPQRGPKRALVDLADQNARHLLEEFKLASLEADERAVDPVYELQRELGLPRVPRSLVCFDISHAQGTDTVASAIWFENGRPRRSEYRKYRIKSHDGNDDFRSMHEVVSRWFRRRAEEKKPMPELVLIDGGKGQLSEALGALGELGLPTATGPAVISLAKREEEVFLAGRSDPVRLPRRSPALRMLQQARDEAHRFAITFQRKKRAHRTITSELLHIPGIGAVRRRSLLKAFGSVQGVREASFEDIAALPGIGETTAHAILEGLGVKPEHSASEDQTDESENQKPSLES